MKFEELIAKLTGEDLSVTKFYIMTSQYPKGYPNITPEENEKRYQELISDLESDDFDYLEVKGKYGGNKEDSVIIFDSPALEVYKLANKYEQGSVVEGFPLMGDYFLVSVGSYLEADAFTQATRIIYGKGFNPSDNYTEYRGKKFRIDF